MHDDALEAARQRHIADACLGRDPSPDRRLGLYRRLVQGNLTRVARRLLPRTADAIDRGGAASFDAWFGRFLAEEGPHTSYLRDVATEFVTWALPQLESSPALADLARYESDLFRVESAPNATMPVLVDVALHRRVVFASPRAWSEYRYAVDEPADDLLEDAIGLLIHRDEENLVRTTRVSRARMPLLTSLLAGMTLGDALISTGTDDRAAVAEWLAELGRLGALLGGDGS